MFIVATRNNLFTLTLLRPAYIVKFQISLNLNQRNHLSSFLVTTPISVSHYFNNRMIYSQTGSISVIKTGM